MAGIEQAEPSRRRAWVLAGASALALALLAVVAFVLWPSSSREENLEFIDSPYPNVDAANTRHAGGAIRGATVSDLDVAWSLPIEAQGEFGGYVASAVVADGVVYSQDADSNVEAIELESGDVLWTKLSESTIVGTNGLVVAGSRVYGTTAGGAFALDRRTGREVWSTTLIRNGSEEVQMAPGYHDGLVYVSTAPGEGAGGEVGVLWALSGKTGEKAWHFDTVPRGLWANRSLNFGGGLTYPPAFDEAGSMYVGVGNAGPIPGTDRYPWGSSRPGPNLYTDSIVKLDARTGRVQWFYQLTPHGLCNWDIGPPVLTKGAAGRELVVAAGLAGRVVALDRETGKPVWERAVGIHNGHDDDGLRAMRGEYAGLKIPMTVYPGQVGGVPMAFSVNRSTAFIPVINAATRLTGQTKARQAGAVGSELVALDLASGAVEWVHRFPTRPDFSSALLAATTAVNDLVLAATFDGTLYAFDAASGREVWTTSLPAGVNAGATVSGATLLVPAGFAREGQEAELVAYRLPAGR